MKRNLVIVSAALAFLFAARPAAAHFPWLAVNDDGKAVYFFGENPADRTYKLPASIAKAKISMVNAKGKLKKVKFEAAESDNFLGLTSVGKVPASARLVSSVTYGIYRGARLNYYSIYQGGKIPKDRSAYSKSQKKRLDLTAQLVDTDSGVDVYVLWKGKPLSGVDVQLFCDDGHEEGNGTTDEAGKVSFSDKEVEDGLNGIMLGHTVKGEAGKFDGEAYQATSHFLTVTFIDPQDFEKSE